MTEAAIANKQTDIEAGVRTEEHDLDMWSSEVSTTALMKYTPIATANKRVAELSAGIGYVISAASSRDVEVKGPVFSP